MKKICILGASGSIGKQTLDVLSHSRNDFELVAFSVGTKTRIINNILKRFPTVKSICIKEEKHTKTYAKLHPNIKFYFGDDGLDQLILDNEIDTVVNALVGFVGLKPTLTALNKNLTVALANKEALVVGGELVNEILSSGKGKIFPIDSEHSAIHKCLAVNSNNVDKVYLTASGGAFRDLTRKQLVNVKPEDALKHPNWKMGKKITIDCATMVNKTFELIEAHYLFDLPYKKLGVTLHRESKVHSYVKYKNNLLRLEIGKPDMRVPIKYALYEGLSNFKTVTCNSLDELNKYHFSKLDEKRYPIIKLAKFIIEHKGTYGAVMNAANEIAVQEYLNNKIKFLEIENLIKNCLNNHNSVSHPDYETLKRVDLETREIVKRIINKEE